MKSSAGGRGQALGVTRSGPSLQTYARFVYAYHRILILGLVFGMAAGTAVHLAQPVRYTSTAHLVIVATEVSGVSDNASDVSIDSALQLLRSDQVVGEAARAIGYPGGGAALNDDLALRPIVNSRIVRLSVAALDPELAQKAAEAMTDRFFTVRAEGLRRTATQRASTVSLELEVVESELDRRYALDIADEEDPETEEEVDQEVDEGVELAPSGTAELVTLRAQLYGELTAVDIAEHDPGYLSRPPTTPVAGGRSGLAITVSSMATIGVLIATAAAALHSRANKNNDRPAATHRRRK